MDAKLLLGEDMAQELRAIQRAWCVSRDGLLDGLLGVAGTLINHSFPHSYPFAHSHPFPSKYY